jgi:copper chaperone NosL
MKKTIFGAAVLLLALAGCGKNQSYEPVEINPEIDVCEICNMSVANENYATEVISTEGDVYKFDDIGCMIEFIHKEIALSEEEIGKQYVRDVETGDWVEIEKAYYVYDRDIWTPMANGVVSFKNKDAAQKYIEKEGKGELLNYDKLLDHPWEWYR